MKRIVLIIEFDGTNYAGFQRQSNAMTVQEKLEIAIFKLTKEKAIIHSCSRTDSKVIHWYFSICIKMYY